MKAIARLRVLSAVSVDERIKKQIDSLEKQLKPLQDSLKKD